MVDEGAVVERGRRVLGGRLLLGPAGGSSGRREYECVFMQPGRVKQADGEPSNWLIPAETIWAAESLFSSVSCYLDHPERFGFGWRQEPKVANLVGVTFGAEWDLAEQAMVGGLRLYDGEPGSPGAFVGALLDQMLADREAGLEVPPVGLSAVVFHDREHDEEEDLWVTTSFRYIESVDVVYDPGAGGYVRRALAAIRPARSSWAGASIGAGPERPAQGIGGCEMLEEVAQESVVEEQPQGLDVMAAIGRLEAQIEDLSVATELEESQEDVDMDNARLDDLTEAVARLTNVVAAQEESRTVVGMGDPPRSSGLSLGRSSVEQIEAAFEALVLGTRPVDNIPPFYGLRDFYHTVSGDYNMSGVWQPDRMPVFLANATSAVMAKITANVLNKLVVNEFMKFPHFWEPAVTEHDFDSLQDADWISLGGISELPTVAEGAAYSEVTWDDFAESDAFEKKGGYIGITLEAIDKDDVSRLRAAPRAMAQGAWKALGKAISNIFTTATGTGPTMSDGNVLFDATNHGNLLTTAWSLAEFRAVKLAMMKQTEIHSGDRLGGLCRPKLVWVPADLEDAVIRDLATWQDAGSGNWNANVDAVGNERETRLANARGRVITCPFWTDVNNWAAQADPQVYPSIGVGYRFGRVPEIYSVADQRAGLMFTNDTMPVKVRFFFAVGPTDWRGLHKSNVSG